MASNFSELTGSLQVMLARISECDLRHRVFADVISYGGLCWAVHLMIVGLPRRSKGTHRLEGHANQDRGRDERGRSTS